MRFSYLQQAVLRAAVVSVGIMAFLDAPAYGQPEVADSKVGYIDSAIIGNQFRLRFDAGYGIDVPDRAEFFYAKCGCFRDPRLRAILGPLFDPDAPGPLGKGPSDPVETNVDYQDISAYLELAASDWLSGFVELPVRFINPEVNDNSAGLADMHAGFKVALLACQDHFLTFQFRTYIPTGDADRGLGTDHVSLEPALLLYERLCDRLAFEGELRDWIPVGGTDFAGNVIRYGVGLSYDLYDCCETRVTPVVELVGWTVLDGKKLPAPGAPVDASGDTIVNLKLGLRFVFGDRSSLYVGYGRALTGDVWYEDVARVEYRVNF